ncbi:MAG TPA: GNAT family N-acetyltransferase [Spirochaetota bacterium]|nr:GNAT family N-acetyltransferase [Spirochaetota bacterium]
MKNAENTMEEITLHNADRDHANAVYNLICELEGETFHRDAFRAIYLVNLSNQRIRYRLAVKENRIIGFGSLHMQDLLHHCGRVGEIQELVVMPEFRNSGVGAILLKDLRAIADENGCVLLEVSCNRDRTDAQRFYEKNNLAKTHFKFTGILE